ncbi:Uncharacterised protein [Vibrio cholerae]|nr:Uncharacterised protein [Vibrio cholerae]CSB30609.1 Uncharacterised protein [Vibrio cholerae]CSB91274.1 Uncharacterised protein [Vibrio cholerae]CSD45907.1 Uncharacterised protein [Vibrio cholerae]
MPVNTNQPWLDAPIMPGVNGFSTEIWAAPKLFSKSVPQRNMSPEERSLRKLPIFTSEILASSNSVPAKAW